MINNCARDDPIVTEEIEDLNFGLQAENEGGKAGWLECFSKRNVLWKRTINGMMLMFFQQLNGQNLCVCPSFSCPSRSFSFWLAPKADLDVPPCAYSLLTLARSQLLLLRSDLLQGLWNPPLAVQHPVDPRWCLSRRK
jgi:hypothetical protein